MKCCITLSFVVKQFNRIFLRSDKFFSDFFSLVILSNQRQLVLNIVWVRRLFRRWDNSFPCTLGILVGDQFVSVSKLCPISANNQTTYMPFGFSCLLGVNTTSHLPAVAAAPVLTHSPFGHAGHMTVSVIHSLAFYTLVLYVLYVTRCGWPGCQSLSFRLQLRGENKHHTCCSSLGLAHFIDCIHTSSNSF